jgi:O-methyltransferase
MLKRIAQKLFPNFYQLLFRFRNNPDNMKGLLLFLFSRNLNISFVTRVKIVYRFCVVSSTVNCAHTEREILDVVRGIFSSPMPQDGCLVEAGSFKGGSAAKISIIAKIIDRKLVVFDSFEGIPENDELNPDGSHHHKPGFWKGGLEEVVGNISKCGEIEMCEFNKGLFDDTLPSFKRPIIACYIDVDLASSTRSCLKYLYPLVVQEGMFFSQDGHLKQVVEVFKNEDFWKKEVGYWKPYVKGLEQSKLIAVKKNEQDKFFR